MGIDLLAGVGKMLGHRRTILVLPLVLGACARPSTVAPTRAVDAAGSVAAAPVKPVLPAAPAHRTWWTPMYERSSLGASITGAVVDPKGGFVSFCEARFDIEHGRYLGATKLGLELILPDGRALRDDYTGNGPVIGTPFDDGTDETTLPGQDPIRAVTSPDGSKVLTIESNPTATAVGQSERVFVTVRALPSLDVEQRLEVHPANVAFFGDHRPIVLASDSGLYEAVDGRLVSLGARFAGVVDLAVSSRGDRALVARGDGSRELVALPSGDRLASLPAFDPAELDHTDLALDATGTVAAYSERAGLFIGDLTGGRFAFTRVDHMPVPRAEETVDLVFSPDSKTLFVASDWSFVAVRREGWVAPHPAPSYALDVPPGFRDAELRDEKYSFSHFASDDHLAPVGLLRAMQNADDTVDVSVLALDPSEFDVGEGSLEDWARLILTRYEGSPSLAHARTWKDDRGRNLEYVSYVREGCDPVDRYVRMSERDGTLYRVIVDEPPGMPPKHVTPHLHTFFDVPLGSPKDRRVVARPPRASGSPC